MPQDYDPNEFANAEEALQVVVDYAWRHGLGPPPEGTKAARARAWLAAAGDYAQERGWPDKPTETRRRMLELFAAACGEWCRSTFWADEALTHELQGVTEALYEVLNGFHIHCSDGPLSRYWREMAHELALRTNAERAEKEADHED